MIDISTTRHAYKRKEITEIEYIRRERNLANALTKLDPGKNLLMFMETRRLTYEIGHVDIKEVADGEISGLKCISRPLRK